VAAAETHSRGAGIAIARESPLAGCGLDAFPLAFEGKRTAEYWNTEWNGTPTKVHCEPIHVLATQGILGAAACAAIALGLLVSTIRAALRASRPELAWIVAIAASLGAFFVAALLRFPVAGTGTLAVSLGAIVSRLGAAARPIRMRRARARALPLALEILLDAAILGAAALLVFRGVI